MISVAGASLIASIYPVGIILILIEGRAVYIVKQNGAPAWIWVPVKLFRWLLIVSTTISTIGIAIVIPACVFAVNDDRAIEGAMVPMVWTLCTILLTACAVATGGLAGSLPYAKADE